MWTVRKFCAIKMYLNAQKEWLAGEAPHLEHHRTRWEKNDKAMKKKWTITVEMRKVRAVYAKMMNLDFQKELLAGDTPHLEHHRTRWKGNEKEMNKL